MYIFLCFLCITELYSTVLSLDQFLYTYIPHACYAYSKSKERDTCTPMFIAALFIIARTWMQPRCPSADE